MTHLFNWKEWLSFVSVFRFQVSSHERNCKNNTVENLPRTMEFLRIYICRENLLHMTWLSEEICSHGLIRGHATFQSNMSLMLAKNHVRKTGGETGRVKDKNLPPFSS